MSFFSKKKKEVQQPANASPPTAQRAEFAAPFAPASNTYANPQSNSVSNPVHKNPQLPPGAVASEVSQPHPYPNGALQKLSSATDQNPARKPNSSSSGPVIYPWSQRPLNYLPISLAPPTPPEFADANPQSKLNQGLKDGPSPPPFPRYGHSVNSLASGSSGDLYIFGGLVNDRACNDLYVLQCAPNSTASIQAARERGEVNLPPSGSMNVGLVETKGEIPSPRLGHASVGVGNVLIVWGGDTNSADESDVPEPNDDALYLLNLSSRDWTRVKIAGPAPEGRYGHAAAMIGSCFYIFGGQNSNTSFLNDLWCFDLQKLKAGNAQWVQIHPNTTVPLASSPMPSQRTGHTIVTFKDNLYMFGGTDGQYHYNDTWEYNTDAGTWTELACSGYIPVAREGHAATLVDDVMYVFAGRGVDGKDLEDLAAFKITGPEGVARRWFMFQHMGPTPSGRSGHAMATWQSKVFVLGGESYSSNQAGYDPHFINVLDSSKIKYPQPKGTRKPSLSQSQPSVQLQQSPPQTQGPLPGPNQQQEELRQRTASPPLIPPSRNYNTASRSNSLVEVANAPGQASTPAILQQRSQSVSEVTSPTSYTSQQALTAQPGAPPRPRRQDDVPQDRLPTGAAHTGSNAQTSSQGLKERPTSPTMSSIPYPSSMNPSNAVNSNFSPQSPPSSLKGQANPLMTSQSSVRTEKAVQWMLAALASASAKGYTLPEEASTEDLSRFSESNTPTDKDKKVLVQALLSVKQELAKTKASMAAHSTAADAKVAASNSARAAATQEAAYYKAKLAAIEACSPDSNKIDRDRITDLELRLSQALIEKKAIQKEAAQYSTELQHERELKEDALERAASTSARVQATESSYSRSLTDYADLQRRAHTHESSIQEHLNNLAALKSQHATLAADHAHVKTRLDASEESNQQYLRTLEQTHAAFQTANGQASDMLKQCSELKEELAGERERATVLENNLQLKTRELNQMQSRMNEMEKLLVSTRAEHAAMSALTNDGLSQLLNNEKDSAKNRETDLVALHEAKIRALAEERDSLRALHADLTSRSSSITTELADTHSKVTTYEKTLAALRTDLIALRSQQNASLQELVKVKSDLAQRDIQLSEQSRLAEANETKAALLRSLMTEHGISSDESLDGSLSASTHGNPLNSEQLFRRVQELEAQLESRTRSQKSLENAHDESRRDLQQAEEQLRSLSRQHIASEEDRDALRQELERARSPTSSTGHGVEDGRSSRAEQELVLLQDKHKTLQDAHGKAAQYVKGTEKMLRKMKDEVNKHKARADDLEAQLAEHRDSAGDAPSKEDFDTMRQQIRDLLSQSQQTADENRELQAKLATMSSDYDAQLRQHATQSTSKMADFEEDIRKLQTALNKTQRELDDTLSLNNQLNGELVQALKRPGSRQGHARSASFNSIMNASDAEIEVKRLRERLELMEEENKALAKRYQISEQRVGMLLDSMERGVMSETSSLNGGESQSHASRLSAELERLALASGHNPAKGLRGNDSASENGQGNSIDSEEVRESDLPAFVDLLDG